MPRATTVSNLVNESVKDRESYLRLPRGKPARMAVFCSQYSKSVLIASILIIDIIDKV